MVRGPRSGNRMQSLVYYPDPADLISPRPQPLTLDSEVDPLAAGMQADGSLAARPGIGDSWQSAGGRWMLWSLRAVLWTALLAIAFRGIIIFSSSPAPADGTGTGTGGEFPVSLAEAYATEFGRVYLGFSPQSPGQREQVLAEVPARTSAANPSLGWNGIGQLNLQSLQVAGIKVQDLRHALVTLLALLGGRLMEELGVRSPPPAAGWWSPASPPGCPRAADRAGRRPRGPDWVAQSQLMNELPAFFQAYASGDKAALNRFRFRGVSVTGLGSAGVHFDWAARFASPPDGAGWHDDGDSVGGNIPDPEQPGATGNLGMASKYRDDIWYVGCRPAKRQMVCKRDWSVDRGGGS